VLVHVMSGQITSVYVRLVEVISSYFMLGQISSGYVKLCQFM